MTQPNSPHPAPSQYDDAGELGELRQLESWLGEAREMVRLYERSKEAMRRHLEDVEAEAERIRTDAEAEARRLIEEAHQQAEATEHSGGEYWQQDPSRQRELMKLVKETQTTLVEKAESAAMWQARAEILAGELRTARETIRALQSGQSAPPPSFSDPAPASEPAPEPPRPRPAPVPQPVDEEVSPWQRPEPPTRPRSEPPVEPISRPDTAPEDDVASRLRAALAEKPAPDPSREEISARLSAALADRAAPISQPVANTPERDDVASRLRAALAGVNREPALATASRALTNGRTAVATPPAPTRRGPAQAFRVTSSRDSGDMIVEPVSNTDHAPAAPALTSLQTLDRLRQYGNYALRGLLVVAILTLLGLLAPKLIGWDSIAVEGGSMEPTIPLGGLIIVQPIAANEVKSGDIITFSDRNRPNQRVTHRVVSSETVDGRRVIRTRGDANNTEDAWDVSTDQPIMRVVTWVPVVGYLVALIGTTQFRFILAGLLLALFVYFLVMNNRNKPEGDLTPRTA